MNDLYEYILESLRKLSKTQNNETQFNQFLRSLKPSVRSLRKAYADHQIIVDYSTLDIQAAYLIAYYPQYAEMTFRALENFGFAQEIRDQGQLTVCLFGSGPSPEIIGLLSYLNQTQIQSVTIETFDIASDTWKLSRNITIEEIRPQIWKKDFSIHSHTLDFCKEHSFHSIQPIIAKSQLFIFQNCLNELFNAKEVVKQNIEFLLESMPDSSMLIIADQGEYQEVVRAMNGIENLISMLNLRHEYESFSIERLEGETAHFSTQLKLPQTIKTHLLTGSDGLIPRKKVRASYCKVLRLVTEARAMFVDRQLIAQLEAELQQLKQVEQDHATATLLLIQQVENQMNQVLDSVETLTNFAENYREQYSKLSNQFTQLERSTQEATTPIVQLQEELQQLKANLNDTASSEQVSQLESALQTIEQRLNQIETERNSILLKDQFDQWNLSIQRQAEIDRDTLIKRLKQNRQITIALTCISVVSFLIASIALFR
ncbi:hypothetical protein ACQ4M3_30275 [Leptolyngbya sp. AN03gr2]|uniref:hypothetical protein n=1 Tax=unclassified Leptolyngbya TaxID=2650499 RepID=UPI003D31ACF6